MTCLPAQPSITLPYHPSPFFLTIHFSSLHVGKHACMAFCLVLLHCTYMGFVVFDSGRRKALAGAGSSTSLCVYACHLVLCVCVLHVCVCGMWQTKQNKQQHLLQTASVSKHTTTHTTPARTHAYTFAFACLQGAVIHLNLWRESSSHCPFSRSCLPCLPHFLCSLHSFPMSPFFGGRHAHLLFPWMREEG